MTLTNYVIINNIICDLEWHSVFFLLLLFFYRMNRVQSWIYEVEMSSMSSNNVRPQLPLRQIDLDQVRTFFLIIFSQLDLVPIMFLVVLTNQPTNQPTIYFLLLIRLKLFFNILYLGTFYVCTWHSYAKLLYIKLTT